MEELKMLIDMVAKLPAMALWVLVGFWAYKVIVVGSIYGLIRFIVAKIHDWLTSSKKETIEITLDGVAINGAVKGEIVDLFRVVRSRKGSGLTYIHGSDVSWIKEAIEEKLQKEREGTK